MTADPIAYHDASSYTIYDSMSDHVEDKDEVKVSGDEAEFSSSKIPHSQGRFDKIRKN